MQSSFLEHVEEHCAGINQFSNIYGKLYAFYVRALAEQSPVHLILAFITDCFGSTNHVYGIDHQLSCKALTEQAQDNPGLTWLVLLADELTDDQ